MLQNQIFLIHTFIVTIVGLIIILLLDFPLIRNPFNANDNSSGIILALLLIEKDNVEVILTDNEEKIQNNQGSFFLFENFGFKDDKRIFFNFDCVGNGNYIAYDYYNIDTGFIKRLTFMSNLKRFKNLPTDLQNMTNIKSIGFSRYDKK